FGESTACHVYSSALTTSQRLRYQPGSALFPYTTLFRSGVIATHRGWNLYVGGNGGAQPAHAQLLVEDLDDETLQRCIDRFLILYIREADKLQRTARCVEEYPGGIDELRRVIVEDSLDIGEELEAAMQRHTDTSV